MSKKKKRIMISDWTAVIMAMLVIASYIWTISFKFTALEHGLKSLEETLERVNNDLNNVKVESRKVPILEYRQEQMEYRIDDVGKKMKP